MAFLETHAARVFCGRIPTDRRFAVCLATVELADAARIDVCGIGETEARAAAAAAGEAAEALSQARRSGDATPLPEAPLLGPACDQGYVRGERLADGAAVAVAAAAVLRGVPMPQGGPPASEGCAAGESFEAAALAAVLELVERDALACWWRSGRPARLVERALVARQGGGTRTLAVLDIGPAALAPVAALLSTDSAGAGFALAAAARPSFAAARAAAERELAQRELALSTQGAERTPRDLADLIGPLAPADAVSEDLPAGSAADSLATLVARAGAQGLEIALVDLTRADLGVPVVKAVAPGLVSSGPARHHPRLAEAIARHGPPPPSRGPEVPI